MVSNNKRIGIITFQRAHNYGAILQVYALQELLKERNCNVSVIDYYPEAQHFYHYSECYRYSLLHPKELIKNLLYLPRRKRRYDSFNSFIENKLDLSRKDIMNICKDYDLVIIGSDQVWNPKNSRGRYDLYYWGNFKENGFPKLISYAASMGNCSNVNWDVATKLLRNFDAISVREEYLKKEIREKCKIDAEWVLDPTLLQTHFFYSNIVIEPNIREPYLFFYQARANKHAYNYAKRWAKKMNLKFVCLSAHIMLQNSHCVLGAGPSEFLGLIKNAKYVITTSFHGTVFCYHFKKNFSTLMLDDGDNGRSESLLTLLGLNSRLISLEMEPSLGNVDWMTCEHKIEEKRNLSCNWLFEKIWNI